MPTHDQSERERRHREIVAAKAQRDEAEAEPDERRHQHADERGERPRDLFGQRPCRGGVGDAVRADAEEAGLPERDLIDVAEQDRKPDRRDREDRRVGRRLATNVALPVRVATMPTSDDDRRKYR